MSNLDETIASILKAIPIGTTHDHIMLAGVALIAWVYYADKDVLNKQDYVRTVNKALKISLQLEDDKTS